MQAEIRCTQATQGFPRGSGRGDLGFGGYSKLAWPSRSDFVYHLLYVSSPRGCLVPRRANHARTDGVWEIWTCAGGRLFIVSEVNTIQIDSLVGVFGLSDPQ